MEDDGNDIIFSEGREYEIIDEASGDGFCVVDDDEDEHWIMQPGDPFFDEYFEVVEC